MLVIHYNVTPSVKFAGTNVYTSVKRGTKKAKYIAQEHNALPHCPSQGVNPDRFFWNQAH